VGIDNSRSQLATARRFQAEFGIAFPLIHADAEAVPLAANSFDLAISEYGASIWCDPYRWIPEAARVLRPGGTLVFLVNSVFLMLTMPDLEIDGPTGKELIRDYFGCIGSHGRTTLASSSTLVMATGFGCFVPTVSRSRT
jgi:ubiquinone/menaquinone biosynthesis C-methylase UbiE